MLDYKALKKDIAILIPAYNEGKYIQDVIKDCSSYGLDIIVVNDGSSDNTLELLAQIEPEIDSTLIILDHGYNKGKGAAIKTGLDYIAGNHYQGFITIDADGQHAVHEIAAFIDYVKEYNSFDLIIIGSRFSDTKGMPFIRLFVNVFTSWIISRIAGKKIEDVQSGFRYIGTNTLKNIDLKTKNFDTEPEMVLRASWAGVDIKNIPIKTIYLEEFKSHVSPFKDTIKFIRLIFKSLRWRREYFLKAKISE